MDLSLDVNLLILAIFISGYLFSYLYLKMYPSHRLNRHIDSLGQLLKTKFRDLLNTILLRIRRVRLKLPQRRRLNHGDEEDISFLFIQDKNEYTGRKLNGSYIISDYKGFGAISHLLLST